MFAVSGSVAGFIRVRPFRLPLCRNIKTMIVKSSLSILLLCMFGIAAHAGVENACIKSSVAAIDGLLPGMNKDALGKAGNYISMETSEGEDDGGIYEAQTFRYPEYDISIVRGMIDSISITSPEFLWAQKIKIGTGRSTVENHVTAAPVVDDATSSQYLVCSGEGDVYAIINYRNDKVETIEILIDRP